MNTSIILGAAEGILGSKDRMLFDALASGIDWVALPRPLLLWRISP